MWISPSGGLQQLAFPGETQLCGTETKTQNKDWMLSHCPVSPFCSSIRWKLRKHGKNSTTDLPVASFGTCLSLTFVWARSMFAPWRVFILKGFSKINTGCDGLAAKQWYIDNCGMFWLWSCPSVKWNVCPSWGQAHAHTSHYETQEHLNKTRHPVILNNWKKQCLFWAM